MKKFVTRYSRITNKNEKYELVELAEKVLIMKELFIIKHKYYKCLSNNELYELFDEPDYNLKVDYDLYRSKYNLLSSDEIKQIRKNLQMNVINFSNMLEINQITLRSIENGSLQTKSLDDKIRRLIKKGGDIIH